MQDTIARARRNTVGDALRRAARLQRDATALIFADRRWSFAELDGAADRVARRFADLGLRAGDRIAAYGRNSDAYFIAWLACVRGGFVHVPVNYALTGEELAYVVRQSGARLVLAAESLEANLDGITVEYRGRFEGGDALDVLAVAQDPATPLGLDPALDEETLGQIVYTSGTTAAPKGAMMTHRA
ncbi:MAG: AMP-binding protein, partial [Rhodospirillales bacterium]|nr:AMP-binding protein [Rhodospirillales bacterium]